MVRTDWRIRLVLVVKEDGNSSSTPSLPPAHRKLNHFYGKREGERKEHVSFLKEEGRVSSESIICCICRSLPLRTEEKRASFLFE
jgi:hypothetical protein